MEEDEPIYENMEDEERPSELNARINPFEPRVNVRNPIYESSNDSQKDGKIPEAPIRRRRDAPTGGTTPGPAPKPTTSSEPKLGKTNKKDDDIDKCSDALETQVLAGGKDAGSEPKITSSGALTFDMLKGRENFDIWRDNTDDRTEPL